MSELRRLTLGFNKLYNYIIYELRGRRGNDHIVVVGFTTTYATSAYHH
jgi:hypothetical protein